jgi:proteasome lid subunit RPN8/RPN11
LAAPQQARNANTPFLGLDGRHGLTGITFSAGVLAEIRRYAVEEHAEDKEAAGLLLGQRVDGTLQVTSFQPLWRSEFGAKHFALNEAEERQWRKQLAKWKAGRGGGIEAVGWFRAHGRGEAYLDAADLELHSRIFSSPWALAMCVRPANQKQTLAALYMKDAGGAWQRRAPLTHMVLHDDGGTAPNWVARRPEVRLVHGFRAGARVIMPLRQWAFYILGLLAAAGGMIAVQQFWTLSARDIPRLTARMDAQNLHLRWDPKAAPRSATSSAFLMVGGDRHNLSEAEFLKGSLELPLTSTSNGDLQVRLQAGEFEDSTHVLQSLR